MPPPPLGKEVAPSASAAIGQGGRIPSHRQAGRPCPRRHRAGGVAPSAPTTIEQGGRVPGRLRRAWKEIGALTLQCPQLATRLCRCGSTAFPLRRRLGRAGRGRDDDARSEGRKMEKGVASSARMSRRGLVPVGEDGGRG
jgi:hypothetical protein